MALLEMRGVSDDLDEPIFTFEPPRTVTTSSGQTFNYDDVVNLILARYAEGKTPALAVKSALQLGFPEDVIRTLPGVDDQAFEAGKELIESGAFAEQAIGTMADIQQAAPVGSAQYNARIAAGLDAFGFPPEEVVNLTAQGLYGPGKQFDPGTPERQAQAAGLLATDTAASKVAQQEKRTVGSVSEPQARAGEGGPTTGLPGQASIVPADVKSQLDAFGPYDPNSEVWYYGGPQIVSDGKIYRKDQSGNIDITVAGGGPGSLQQVVSPTGELLLSTTDTGETSRLMAFAQNALPAAAAAALLGPAGAGLLSTPAAAAAGAGGTTLAKGGSVEDALKAAVLSGVAAYGLDYLLASPELLAARELASSGMSEDAIIDTLISRGASANAAIEAASNATGLPAAGSARGLGDFTSTGATSSVPVTGTAGASVGAITPAAVSIGSAFSPGLLNQAATQQVQVQNQTGGANVMAAAPAALGGLLNQQVQLPQQRTAPSTTLETTSPLGAAIGTAVAPPQTVSLTSQTLPTTQQAAGPAGAMLGTAIAPAQMVEVEGRTIPTATPPATITGGDIAAGTASNVKDLLSVIDSAKLPVPGESTSPFSKTDAALAALLLGGAGSLLNQSQTGGFTMDPNLANAIINAPRPTYGRGIGGYQMPGMFQIAPTNVYNPFATTAPFGTGRFGGFAAPITLPSGLL